VLPRHEGDGVGLGWPRKEPGMPALQDYAERLRQALA
jgi:histidine triad (HIT) family protein